GRRGGPSATGGRRSAHPSVGSDGCSAGRPDPRTRRLRGSGDEPAARCAAAGLGRLATRPAPAETPRAASPRRPRACPPGRSTGQAPPGCGPVLPPTSPGCGCRGRRPPGRPLTLRHVCPAKRLQSPWPGISPVPACSLFPDGSTSHLAAHERPNREACAMASTRKILIVDDDTELRDALVEQLALHEEFEAVAAENGTKGVQAARAGHVDLVSMDG